MHNLVTDGMQNVDLAFESGEPDVTDRRLRLMDEGIVSSLLWERTAVVGGLDRTGSITQMLTSTSVSFIATGSAFGLRVEPISLDTWIRIAEVTFSIITVEDAPFTESPWICTD